MRSSWLNGALACLGRGGAALAAFVLFCAAPAQAQPGTGCPKPGKKGDGADIQCRVDAILAKHETLIGTMKEKLGNCVGRNCDLMEEHLKKVESAQARAKAQHGRVTAEDYEEVNKTRKAKCRGKNCLESPQDLDVGPEIDTGLGEDLVDQLDEIGEDLDKSNAMLSETAGSPIAMAALQASAGPPDGFRPLYDSRADPDYPSWLHIADNTKALIPASFAMTFAAQAALKSSSVLENGCQQDIFGTNTSLICLVIDIVAVALDSTAKLLAYNLSDATAWDAKGAYMRAADLNHNLGIVDGRVAAVGASVGSAQAAVAALQAKATVLKGQMAAQRQRLIVAQNQIIQLLLVPQGSRVVPASILTCDGITTACPSVEVNCSPTTGLCTYK